MPSKRKAPTETPEEEPPTSIDPYEILEVSQDATDDQIRKAYRKAALQHHPDKVQKDQADQAKERFQRIAFAYAILSDPRRRSRYDATGSTSETLLDAEDDFDWMSFYRTQYHAVVTEEKIEALKAEYKNSAEEQNDVLNAYRKYKGDMNYIYETVMFSHVLEDDDRLRSIIDEGIKDGQLPEFEAYTKETEQSKDKRKQKAEKEAKEANRALQKLHEKKKAAKPDSSEAELLAQIQNNQKKRAGFLDNLEAKYAGNQQGKKSRGKKRNTPDDGPSEEAFKAMGDKKAKKKAKS